MVIHTEIIKAHTYLLCKESFSIFLSGKTRFVKTLENRLIYSNRIEWLVNYANLEADRLDHNNAWVMKHILNAEI